MTLQTNTLASLHIATIIERDCFAAHIRQLNRKITNYYDASLRDLNITMCQLTLLNQISLHIGISATDISTNLDIEKSTLSRNLKRLVALNLIEMRKLDNSRSVGLYLTRYGAATHHEAYSVWTAAQEYISSLTSSVFLRTLKVAISRLP